MKAYVKVVRHKFDWKALIGWIGLAVILWYVFK